MHIIFLNERTLAVVDYAIASSDFEIILDTLVPQTSTFNINKTKIKAEVGDYLTIKERDYFYIGIISAIEEVKEGHLKVSAVDFLSKFNVEVPISSFNGNISQFLVNLITSHFKTSGDSKQNMPYLQTEIMVTKSGNLSYEPDKKISITKLVEEFSKTYGIRLAYELVIQNGVFTNIKVSVVSVDQGVILRSDLGSISDLSIADTNQNTLNKITYYPKASNVSHRTIVNYFLLTDGTISTNANSNKRMERVNFMCEFFADSDYSSLLTKATSNLIDSSLEHYISFDFSFSTNKIESLKSLTLGTFVKFITPNKTYETIVTKIKYKGTFKQATIVLGEYRISLTDKLKLLNRRRT